MTISICEFGGLFGRDQFSDSLPVFSLVSGDKRAEVVDILKLYDLSLDLDSLVVSQVGSFEINSNNFLLECNEQSFILKLHNHLPEELVADLEKQSTLNMQLYKIGASCAAPIVSNSGKYLSSGGFNHSVSLTSYVDGSYFTGLEELNTIGEDVGLFHAQLNKIEQTVPFVKQYPFIPKENIESFETVLDDFHSILPHLNHKSQNLLNESLGYLNIIWEDVKFIMDYSKESDVSLFHLDLHPHNMIMGKEGVRAFIDLDSLVLGPMDIMIGFSSFKLVRQAICHRLKFGSVSPSELLNSYLGGIYVHLPKLEQSRAKIKNFARAEVCRRIAIIFRLNLVDNNPIWNHVLDIQLRGLQEIEILFERAGKLE